jgi:formylmethanofuran dehydrogenase subunit B
MAVVADSVLRRDIVCPFCGLACDDLIVAVSKNVLTVRDAGCALSRRGFERTSSPTTPQVRGRSVSMEAAVAHAAGMLAASRQPLFAGLATDTDGARAAIKLAERMGGIVDHLAADGLFCNLRVVQDSGWMTTTLSEVRNHMDMMLIVGPDPTGLFPRLFERCVAPAAATGPPRRIVRLGPPSEHEDGSGNLTVELLPCPLELLPEATAAVRCYVIGHPFKQAAIAGPEATRLQELAAALKGARYGVISWVAAELANPGGELLTQALADLVRDLNQATRCAAMPLTGSDNLLGVNQVCTWQSGVPLRTNYGRGVPEHDPILYATARLLAEDEPDILVWVSAFRSFGLPSHNLPTIVLGTPDSNFDRMPEVFIPVGTPGMDHDGQIFRTDGVVALPLSALRPSHLPSVATVFDCIDQALSAGDRR